MKTNKILEESEVKIKEQSYGGKSDAVDFIVTDKRLYVDVNNGGDAQSHVAQIKDVNGVSLKISKVKRNHVVALIFMLITLVAGTVLFILSPSSDVLMPIAIACCVVGGILLIVWITLVIPKYSITMDVVISGYSITVNIGISNVDSAKALQKVILLQSQKANEPIIVQESEQPEVQEI